jgi:stalled ribosome alternative rescue factor ArfA
MEQHMIRDERIEKSAKIVKESYDRQMRTAQRNSWAKR